MRHHFFENSEDLADGLADVVARKLEEAILERGNASLAVSGGSTPKLFFRKLSERELDWSNVEITLVDERWVPIDSERSNAGLVAANLLREWARVARFVPLFVEGKQANEALGDIEARLSSMHFPLDAVVLGMGTDGHTASFFPGGSRLAEAMDPEAEYRVIDMEAEGAGEARVTLTLPVICGASNVYLHAEGKEKKKLLDKVMKLTGKTGFPVETVMQHCPDTEIYWA